MAAINQQSVISSNAADREELGGPRNGVNINRTALENIRCRMTNALSWRVVRLIFPVKKTEEHVIQHKEKPAEAKCIQNADRNLPYQAEQQQKFTMPITTDWISDFLAASTFEVSSSLPSTKRETLAREYNVDLAKTDEPCKAPGIESVDLLIRNNASSPEPLECIGILFEEWCDKQDNKKDKLSQPLEAAT